VIIQVGGKIFHLTNATRIGAVLDGLLASMALPVGGNVEARRARFAKRIGMRCKI